MSLVVMIKACIPYAKVSNLCRQEDVTYDWAVVQDGQLSVKAIF